jgi:hypothetical protein
MFTGLRRLLLDAHHLTLEMTLDFIYEQLPRFTRKKNRVLALTRLLLDKRVFRHLFFYWNSQIRGLFHHILAYRVFFEQGRNTLKLRSDTYFLGNQNDSSSYQQHGKRSPKSGKKPKWIRRMNIEMGSALDDCFDPVIRASKRTESETKRHPARKHVYLKKSMKEYKIVLVSCYKKLLTRKDLNSIAPKLAHIKDFLQNQTKRDGRDMQTFIDAANKSEKWAS